jgi:hypothetical protein
VGSISLSWLVVGTGSVQGCKTALTVVSAGVVVLWVVVGVLVDRLVLEDELGALCVLLDVVVVGVEVLEGAVVVVPGVVVGSLLGTGLLASAVL